MAEALILNMSLCIVLLLVNGLISGSLSAFIQLPAEIENPPILDLVENSNFTDTFVSSVTGDDCEGLLGDCEELCKICNATGRVVNDSCLCFSDNGGEVVCLKCRPKGLQLQLTVEHEADEALGEGERSERCLLGQTRRSGFLQNILGQGLRNMTSADRLAEFRKRIEALRSRSFLGQEKILPRTKASDIAPSSSFVGPKINLPVSPFIGKPLGEIPPTEVVLPGQAEGSLSISPGGEGIVGSSLQQTVDVPAVNLPVSPFIDKLLGESTPTETILPIQEIGSLSVSPGGEGIVSSPLQKTVNNPYSHDENEEITESVQLENVGGFPVPAEQTPTLGLSESQTVNNPLTTLGGLKVPQTTGNTEPLGISQATGTPQTKGINQPTGISKPIEIPQPSKTSESNGFSQPIITSKPKGTNSAVKRQTKESGSFPIINPESQSPVRTSVNGEKISIQSIISKVQSVPKLPKRFIPLVPKEERVTEEEEMTKLDPSLTSSVIPLPPNIKLNTSRLIPHLSSSESDKSTISEYEVDSVEEPSNEKMDLGIVPNSYKGFGKIHSDGIRRNSGPIIEGIIAIPQNVNIRATELAPASFSE